MTTWALIPARGGSKGIKRKNLQKINGKTLLEIAIENAKKSNQFEKIFVSSEDKEILGLASELGANTHIRDHFLAQDDSTTESVFTDFLSGIHNEKLPELIACCECTSPFIKNEHFLKVIEQLKTHPELNCCMTVCEVDHTAHAYNQRFIDRDFINFVFPFQRSGTRRQTKPVFYKFGNLVVARVGHLLGGNSFFSGNVGYVKIPKLYSVNIDEEDDLVLADALSRTVFNKHN